MQRIIYRTRQESIFKYRREKVENINPKFKRVVVYAKSKGFLSPLWLMPDSEPQRVQQAFQELDVFLKNSYQEGHLTELTLTDIDTFMWQLKKSYAFKGWDGIAPYLLAKRMSQKANDKEMNS